MLSLVRNGLRTLRVSGRVFFNTHVSGIEMLSLVRNELRTLRVSGRVFFNTHVSGIEMLSPVRNGLRTLRALGQGLVQRCAIIRPAEFTPVFHYSGTFHQFKKLGCFTLFPERLCPYGFINNGAFKV